MARELTFILAAIFALVLAFQNCGGHVNTSLLQDDLATFEQKIIPGIVGPPDLQIPGNVLLANGTPICTSLGCDIPNGEPVVPSNAPVIPAGGGKKGMQGSPQEPASEEIVCLQGGGTSCQAVP